MGYNIQTGMYEGYIYCIENLINNKKYIGYTKNDLSTRWEQHLSKTHHKEDNSILHLAIEKYKEYNFKIYVICMIEKETSSELMSQLKLKEKYYINQYNTLTPNGYNILSGGETVPINRITKLYQYTMDGEFIRSYESITNAIQLNGFEDNPKSGKLLRCLYSNHCAFGYLWDRHLNNNIKQLYLEYMANKYKRKNSGSIVQLDMNMNILHKYKSVADASKLTGFPYSSIYAACCGVYGHGNIYREHIWMWETKYDCFISNSNVAC